jgi:4-amino-4-deoxy-L-arabinose transferase-like glycosyltransferase
MGSQSPSIAEASKASGWKTDGLILSALWLVAAVCDRLWLLLDHSVPAWDQGDHLSRSLDYWQALQQPQFLAADWWWHLWQLSPSYRGPWVYLLTVPFLNLAGPGFDQATLVNLVFTALIMLSLYLLGRTLFSRQVGVWAAGLSLLAPALAYQRTDYLLDYGLTAMVTVTFTSLTLWWFATGRRWLWSAAWGLGLGLIFLTKPTGIFFLFFPCLYLLIQLLLPKRRYQGRRIERLVQFGLALVLSLLVALPWFRASWLTIITSALGANAVGAREGDPGNTLAGWLYYGQQLPEMVSWPVLYFSLGGLLTVIGLWISGQPFPRLSKPKQSARQTWIWLALFGLAAYAFCSLATNKDNRFILPYLPVVILVLAYCLTLLPGRWGSSLRWATVGLASINLLVNLFPLPFPLAGQHRPYTGPAWPHPQVIAEVRQQAPYLRSTIGLNLASPQVNAFTFDFYGKLQDFQVYAREPDWSAKQVQQNSRSWDWYLTKTSQPMDLGADQMLLQAEINRSPDLSILKTWTLPDRTLLRLHQRRSPPVVVQPLSSVAPSQVELAAVKLPAQAKPGQPVPVTYQVIGPWQQLQNGVLVLTWQRQPDSAASKAENSAWIHDHGIGLGNLMAGSKAFGFAVPEGIAPNAGFQVTEHLSMLPPANLPPGDYQLTGLYLDRTSGKPTALPMPNVKLKLEAAAPATPAPELDWSTQLRQLVADFRQGKLDNLFSDVARINLYDPTQDYLSQTARSLSFRLAQNPNRLDWWYNLALAQALQINPAVIQTSDRITQLDPNNFYAWAYSAVVHLYFWQPWQAQTALTQAEKLTATRPEQEILQLLQGATALMQFNLPRAWTVLSPLIKN